MSGKVLHCGTLQRDEWYAAAPGYPFVRGYSICCDEEIKNSKKYRGNIMRYLEENELLDVYHTIPSEGIPILGFHAKKAVLLADYDDTPIEIIYVADA